MSETPRSESTWIRPGFAYRVAEGDDLLLIARRLYGKPDWWPRIFEANSDVLDTPLAVRPGQILRVPDPN
jgi:nucleoid-associated protein YgaU